MGRSLRMRCIFNCGATAYLATLVLCALCQTQEPVIMGENSSIIKLGSTLTTNQNSSWLSQNNTFAFGFYPVGPYTYTLSIWYAAILERTVVWTANRNSLVIEGATLSFNGDGNLVLMDSLQMHPVWESNTSLANVVTAELLDSGNFVLRNAQLENVWESFSFPSDTLLPDQILSAGSELVSDHANNNAALGRYSLKQDADGSLRLYYLPSYTWYWSATTDNYSDSFSYLNSSGFLALYNSSGSVLSSWMTTDVGSGPLRHLKLGVGGDLRIYSWSEDLASWVVVWKALSDECSVVDLCGPYGLCRFEPEPMCACPPKFAFVNPQDYSQGCQPPLPLNCSTGSPGQQFLKLDNTQYQSDAYINLQGVSEMDCMSRCSDDCACLGIFYFYNGNGTCSLKSQQQTGHVDPTGNSYVKVNALINLTETVDESPHNRAQRRLVRPEIVAIIVCAFSLACFLLTACCYHWWKEVRAQRRRSAGKWAVVDFVPGTPSRFSFKDLQAATLNFSMKIGSGDFGTVYKGVLPDGTPVAVKKLETSHHLGDKQFREEVAVIANTHHHNLARLYGCCSEGSARRLLVYELVDNGSLDKFIFSEAEESKKLSQIMEDSSSSSTRACLDWKKRFEVLLGTARAIAYLHEQCRERILHCHIRLENILLDGNFEAKVSDFGIAKLTTQKPKEQTKVLSNVKGSRSYLAPECLSSSSVMTTKSDVYSFGLMILEAVSARRRRVTPVDNAGSTPVSMSHAQRLFSDWGFYRAITHGELTELVDKNLGRKFNSVEAERALQVAAWCVQDDPASRPSMGNVLHMLEGLKGVPPPSITRRPLQNSQEHASQIPSPDNEAAPANALSKPGSVEDGILDFDLNSPLISKME